MELQEIGQRLQERRNELGLTLKDVQRSTKIRTRYLKALESGDYDIMPADVYTKGIIRSYAEELGLDGLELVREYKRWRSTQPTEEERFAEALNANMAPVTVSRAVGGVGLGRTLLTVAVFVVLLAAILGVSYLVLWAPQAGEPPLPDEPFTPGIVDPQPENRPDTEPDSEGEEPGAPGEGEDEPGPTEPEPVEPEVRVEQGPGSEDITYHVGGAEDLRVSLEVTGEGGPCWCRVYLDGAMVAETTLPVGHTASWQAKERIYIRAGNPGGISLTINGREIGRPSPTGPKNLIVVPVQQ